MQTQIGAAPVPKYRRFVMTERASHEALSALAMNSPVAAAVLHRLIAYMGSNNALVISQAVLASRIGVHPNSITKAVKKLASERWIQVVKIGKGKEAAYVVNDRVAWGEPRKNMRLSTFSAAIVADHADQDYVTLDEAPLRRIPALFAGEMQLPSGPGLPPVSQPHLPDMEPDLPALVEEERPEEQGYCPVCGPEGHDGSRYNEETLAAIDETTARVGLTSVSFEEFCDKLQRDLEEGRQNDSQN